FRASPANTSGGKPANCASTAASFAASGYLGACSTGFCRQLSGVHRGAMVLSHQRNLARYTLILSGGASFASEASSALLRGFAPDAFRGSAHRHDLLGERRVKGGRGVEVGLRGPHADRDGEELDQLRCVRPDDVTAEDPVGIAIHDQLDEH